MKPSGRPVTVGVDVGTTSVKALAVDEDGQVVARARVPHSVVAPEPDILRHDAKRAWHAGPRKAFEQVTAQLDADGSTLAGVAVASMVPSLTAVNRRGVPVLPGLLYGDREGRQAGDAAPSDGVLLPGTMPDAEGFLRWAAASAPDARGYWPCQAVATHALSGVPAVDTGVTTSLGLLHTRGRWNTELLGTLGASEAQMPVGGAHGPGGRHAAGKRRRHHGGHHRRPVRPDRGGRHPTRRRPRDLRGDPDLLGRVRGVGRGPRPHQLSAHHPRALPHRRPEQRRRPLRGLGPPAAARHAAPRSRARAARAAPGRPRPCPRLAALRPGRAHAFRGPHAALQPLRARHRVGGGGARARRLRGERVRGPPHARPFRGQGHPHRGQRRRLAGDGVDGGGGRCHRPPGGRGRRPGGRRAGRGLLRPHGGRARDVARRLDALVRRGPPDRTRPGLGGGGRRALPAVQRPRNGQRRAPTRSG